MIVKLAPEGEYQIMLDFFKNNKTDAMPPKLNKLHTIWKRADSILRKNPAKGNSLIARQLIIDFPEYNLTQNIATKHVINAKKYFNDTQSDTSATHIRILSEIAYKQIAILIEHQFKYPSKAPMTSKSIEMWVNRISSINGVYDKKNKSEINNTQNNLVLMLSSSDISFPDIPQVLDKDLYNIIDNIAKRTDISPSEKKQIIDKDVKNRIL